MWESYSKKNWQRARQRCSACCLSYSFLDMIFLWVIIVSKPKAASAFFWFIVLVDAVTVCESLFFHLCAIRLFDFTKATLIKAKQKQWKRRIVSGRERKKEWERKIQVESEKRMRQQSDGEMGRFHKWKIHEGNKPLHNNATILSSLLLMTKKRRSFELVYYFLFSFASKHACWRFFS